MSEPSPVSPARRSIGLRVIVILLVLAVVVGGLVWWFTRPIQPVVLSPRELSLVEEKIAAIQSAGDSAVPVPSPTPGATEPAYEPGKKEIVLTEREINGLLNANTDLGRTLSIQLGTDIVLARMETDLDPDLPLLGGRRFKARARFRVSEVPGQPAFIIDDLTIWGISLPNAWLGGLKGRNLLPEILGTGSNGQIPGVESFSVRPGQLSIRLTD